MTPAITVLIILGLSVVAFLSNKIPPGVVAMTSAGALFVTGILPFEATIAGFGDPVVIFIASLFIVSAALEKTGVTAWLGNLLVEKAGTSRSRVLLGLMVVGAVLTALITVNGAVAALVPVAIVLALRTQQPPSRLLIPLAFAAHAGSLLTLMGSPVNLLVSEMAVANGYEPFAFFEFAVAGVPLLFGTIVIIILIGPRLLPDRVPEDAPKDLSTYPETLIDQYDLPEGEFTVDRHRGLVEVVVAPRSSLEGNTVFPGMQTPSHNLIIAAISRGGKHIQREVELQVGDVLLLGGAWEDIRARAVTDPGVTVVEDPREVIAQAVRPGPQATKAMIVVVLMIIALAFGVAPPAFVAMAAALAMLLSGVLTVSDAHRSLSITTLVIIAGMIPMSVAIQTSGAADLIADGLMSALGDAPPRVVLLGLALVVLVLGQFASNVATVLIVAPIALSVAAAGEYSVLPFLMGLAVAGAAAFFTPIATPANMMIYAPGGYKFSDYWRLGLPLSILYIIVAVGLVPVVWPF